MRRAPASDVFEAQAAARAEAVASRPTPINRYSAPSAHGDYVQAFGEFDQLDNGGHGQVVLGSDWR